MGFKKEIINGVTLSIALSGALFHQCKQLLLRIVVNLRFLPTINSKILLATVSKTLADDMKSLGQMQGLYYS